MSDLAFAEAARPRPPVILRVPLLPYSLGHELILTRDRNCMLASDDILASLAPEVQRAGLIRAVMVCSRTWAENARPDRWLRLWGWFICNENFDAAIAAFRSYRHAGSTCPRILPPENGEASRSLGSPFLARISAYAGSIFGAACYDHPLGMLQWMYWAQVEYEGACRVENAFERQVREEIEAHEAAYKKEQEAKSCLP